MRALIIDDEARSKAKQVVEYAAQHHYFPGTTHNVMVTVPGDNPNHVVMLNTYRCVFTFTERDGMVWRHLSVSVPSEAYPNPIAVTEIAGLFGFTGAEKGLYEQMAKGTWLVNLNKTEHCIVLVEPIHGVSN